MVERGTLGPVAIYAEVAVGRRGDERVNPGGGGRRSRLVVTVMVIGIVVLAIALVFAMLDTAGSGTISESEFLHFIEH